jgi:hypothetical protein
VCGRRREHVRAKVPARTLASIGILLAIVLGVVASPRSALARSESYALSWSPSADPPCVAPEALEEAVVARLGRAPFVAVDRADVILDGRELSSLGGRPRARVVQRARDGRVLGTRELEAASCADLTRLAAFVIVLIVDPDALVRETDPEAPRMAPPERPSVGGVRELRPLRRRKQAASLVQAGAAVTFASGLLPGGDMGGLVMLGLSPWSAPLRLEWRGSYRLSLGAPRSRGFSALVQEWRACYLFHPRHVLGGSACAGFAWAAITPETSGLAEGDQASKSLSGATLALGPTLHLGAFAIVADASVLFPHPRYAFSYLDDAGDRQRLYEVERVVVSATIGVTRAFW